ncbi:hypothetical protein PDE_00185 [Penicillium oxalicum 114-2]|uniref:Uncharacterized protein n=1 Tax=Penicillium oxalicum (strain 114-2 / CGMCC 5302) TaxID=933388 RepID=S8ATU8_PENO1|nr:hypothetical protein PDE_00185 [Penicillium oxalicum 114-2]
MSLAIFIQSPGRRLAQGGVGVRNSVCHVSDVYCDKGSREEKPDKDWSRTLCTSYSTSDLILHFCRNAPTLQFLVLHSSRLHGAWVDGG